MNELRVDGDGDAPLTYLFAHGAGAGMEHPFMAAFATGLAARGWRVVRFEFPYMADRRKTGKRGAPNKEPVLREAFLSQIEAQRDAPRLVIGGKSMGGRIASLVADEAGVDGWACLGYPFHPVGKPERLRTEHLMTLETPALIVQGERDSFGRRDEVEGYGLPASIQCTWLADGDHSLKPRKSSGRTTEENWRDAEEALDAFFRERVAAPRRCG